MASVLITDQILIEHIPDDINEIKSLICKHEDRLKGLKQRLAMLVIAPTDIIKSLATSDQDIIYVVINEVESILEDYTDTCAELNRLYTLVENFNTDNVEWDADE